MAGVLLAAWWLASGGKKTPRSSFRTATNTALAASRPASTNAPTAANAARVAPAPQPAVAAKSEAPPERPLDTRSISPTLLPRPVQSVLEAQIALARVGISPGSIDGVIGTQTRAALRAFQRARGLPATGELDAPTRDHLQLQAEPFTNYVVTAGDLDRLQPLSPTWLGKSQQTALEYETILELVAEKSQAHPNLIRRLNPSVTWTQVVAGTTVKLPAFPAPDPDVKAAFVVIRLSDKTLETFDSQTNLLAHFPCSIAQRVEKRPDGELHVEVVAPNPNYTFDPEIFPESAEARQLQTKLVLPPGPNNPVGVVWIGLDKPGYGIHGTPNPEQVGRTESHGCFRLANWNAELLLKQIRIGTPVYVE